MKTGLPNNHQPPVGVGEKPTKDAALQIEPPVLFALVGVLRHALRVFSIHETLEMGKNSSNGSRAVPPFGHLSTFYYLCPRKILTFDTP